MDLGAHGKEQTALAPSTMKVKDELPDVTSSFRRTFPLCGVFANQVSLASGFHDTSFQNITKCDADILCLCTPCRACSQVA